MDPSDSSPPASGGYVFPLHAYTSDEVSQFPVLSLSTRRPLRPRRVQRLHLPAAWPLMLAWSSLTDWPLSLCVTRLIWVRLSLRLAPSPSRGFAGRITPNPRPLGYMANGSFQGRLLSVYETETGFTDAPEAQRRGEEK